MAPFSTVTSTLFNASDDDVLNYKTTLEGHLSDNSFADKIDTLIGYAKGNKRMMYNPHPIMGIYITAQTIYDNINDADNKSLDRWNAQFGTLDTTGATTINNTLTVTGASTLSGATTVNGAATIYGAATINNTLIVTGTSTLNALNVTGATTLTGDVTGVGTSTLQTLNVTGNTNMTGTLNVTGATTLIGTTTLQNTLAVSGTTTLTGDVTGVGTSSLNALNVTGNTNMTGNLTTTGSLTVSGASTIHNNLTVTGTFDVTNAVTLDSSLTVSGNTNMTGTLTVTGDTVLAAGTNKHAYLGSVQDDHKLVTIKELQTHQEGLHPKPASYVMIGYNIGASFQGSATNTVNRTYTVENVTTSYSVSTYTLDLSGINIDTDNTGLTIDGVTITTSQEGQIILINQPSGATYRNENGMYEILNVDEANETLELVRIQEADGQPGNDLSVGHYTLVTNGKKYQGGWACSQTPAAPTSTTTDIITFAQFSGAGELEITAGSGITVTGSYDGSIHSYQISSTSEGITVDFNAGNSTFLNDSSGTAIYGLTGSHTLPEICKYIDNNFKVIFQNLSVDGYDFKHFYEQATVTNSNPSSTDDISQTNN